MAPRGTLDAFISSKKASSATTDKLETGSNASPPPSPQPLKRKRADNNDVPAPKRQGPMKKGYAPPDTYSHLPPLPDTLIPNLLCAFVGLNPGVQTATKGHPYAHPSNLYWTLLHTSGLTPDRRLAPSEYVILPEKYSLGNTNIVSRATRDGSQLSKEEMVAGAGVLDEKIRQWKPEVVCLVGKSIWEAVWKWKHGRGIKKGEFKYGFQDEGENMGKNKKAKDKNGVFFGKGKGTHAAGEDEKDHGQGDVDRWEGARVFVATSTSGLAASLSLREKEEIWAELGGWVKRRREERESAKVEGKGEATKSSEDVVVDESEK